MAARGNDDDFDPTRVLDGWRAALSGAAGPADVRRDPERLARLRRRGYEMRDVEDAVAAPEIRLPAAPPPPAFDAEGLAEALRGAARLAGASAPATGVPTLELPRRQPPPHPRLLAQWQPGAWIGLARRAIAASTELSQGPAGPLLESHAPGWLLALWPPQGLDRPLLSRWPQQLQLLHLEQEALAGHLLAAVPASAPLWLAGELEPDWALIAELVLHHEPALRPAQLQALREFIETERQARFARLNQDYVRQGGAIRARGGPLSK